MIAAGVSTWGRLVMLDQGRWRWSSSSDWANDKANTRNLPRLVSMLEAGSTLRATSNPRVSKVAATTVSINVIPRCCID
jgi:hypothetical protein